MTGKLILSEDRKTIVDVIDKDFTSVNIPDDVNTIGHRAFEFCHWLSSIDIPQSVTEIEDFAFFGCKSLQSFNVDSNNPIFSSKDGVLFKEKTSLFLFPPGNKTSHYSVPEGVTAIGEFAFEDCSNLQSILMPDSVTEIGMGAFLGCYALQSINIPVNIFKIGAFAFEDTALESVIIPNSVKEICNEAFRRSKLKAIHMKPIKINNVHIEEKVFQDISTDCTLYVPKEALDDYRCHPVFGQFKNITLEE